MAVHSTKDAVRRSAGINDLAPALATSRPRELEQKLRKHLDAYHSGEKSLAETGAGCEHTGVCVT